MYPKITPQNFKPYGKVIYYPGKERKKTVRNLWRIVHCETARVGWRVAYLVLRDKTIGRLECHPYSDETFEPIRGRALFFVSLTKNFANIRCFVLDKPVMLRKGVWHGLVALGREAEIKITENASVTCRYWPLKFRMKTLADLSK